MNLAYQLAAHTSTQDLASFSSPRLAIYLMYSSWLKSSCDDHALSSSRGRGGDRERRHPASLTGV